MRLKNGEMISGKVSAVSEKTVHLTALTGQEFFEALIVLEDISAIAVRAAAKQRIAFESSSSRQDTRRA